MLRKRSKSDTVGLDNITLICSKNGNWGGEKQREKNTLLKNFEFKALSANLIPQKMFMNQKTGKSFIFFSMDGKSLEKTMKSMETAQFFSKLNWKST